MWKRLLAGIFGLIGLVVWKRFLGEDSQVSDATPDDPAEALQRAWARSASMSGKEFEHFMADLLRAAGYKVDRIGRAGDQQRIAMTLTHMHATDHTSLRLCPEFRLGIKIARRLPVLPHGEER
jgi:N-acyl-L-homoserine lactone synthetase